MADVRLRYASGLGYKEVSDTGDRLRAAGLIRGDGADLQLGVNSADNYAVDFVNIGAGNVSTIKLNGTQISSAVLSDVASIAMLDEVESVAAKWSWTGFDGEKIEVKFTANDETAENVAGIIVKSSADATLFKVDSEGDVTVQGNLLVNGTETIVGGTTFQGDVTFGNETTDKVTFTARVAGGTSIVPETDSTVDLGSTALGYGHLYLADVTGDGVSWGNAVADLLYSSANSRLELTGSHDDLYIAGDLTVNGTITGATATSGTTAQYFTVNNDAPVTDEDSGYIIKYGVGAANHYWRLVGDGGADDLIIGYSTDGSAYTAKLTIEDGGNVTFAGNISGITDLDVNGGASISGTIDNDGSAITIGDSLVPDAAGLALGSTTTEWGSLYLGDDGKAYFGADQDAWIEYDETTDDRLEMYTKAVDGGNSSGILISSGATTTSGDSGDVILMAGTAAGTRGLVKFQSDVLVDKTGNDSYKLYFANASGDDTCYIWADIDTGTMSRSLVFGAGGATLTMKNQSGESWLLPSSGFNLGDSTYPYAALYLNSSSGALMWGSGASAPQITGGSGGFSWWLPDNQASGLSISAIGGGATFQVVTTDDAEAFNFSGAIISMAVKDNNAVAFLLEDANGDDYMKLVTTTSGEWMYFGNATNNPKFSFLGSGEIDADNGTLRIPSGANLYIGGTVGHASLTGANLNTLVNGGDASALHTHSSTTGQITGQTTTGFTVAGEVGYISAASTWGLAVCNSTQSAAYVSAAYVSSGVMERQIAQTLYCVTGLTITAGDMMYVSATAGQATNVAPSTSGQFVTKLGRVLSSTYGSDRKVVVIFVPEPPVELA